MIEFILFDIGGVFFSKNEARKAEIMREFGISEEELSDVKNTDLYQTYKRGDMSEEDFVTQVKDVMPQNFTGSPKDFFLALSLSKALDQSMFHLLQDLRNKYRVGVLSNSDSFLEARLEHYQLYEQFEFVINSYRVRMKKPQQEIFELALDRIGLSPDTILFVDDKKRNTDVAQKVGMKSHVFESADHFIQSLDSYGLHGITVT